MKVVHLGPALAVVPAIAVLASIAHAGVSPAVKCGVAYSKLQAVFARDAAKLAPALCVSPAEFNTRAAALVAKINAKIASFNAAYSDAGCDVDIEFPVPDKDTAQVMLVLQNEFGAVPLDKYCNALPDSPEALCGNAGEDPGEVCDLTDLGGQSCESLGNGEGTLACSPDCQGFDLSGCTGTPICGDGVPESGESCDTGGESASCDVDCTAAQCSDGLVNGAAGELCDDGNVVNSDACLDTCQPAWCGDGYLRTGVETCDDQNTNNTDACLNSCQIATCGDGVTRAGVESCDDGNAVQTDACTNTCQVAICGDGLLRSGVEQCDDGNAINADACVNTCENARCGDGFIRTGIEQCDDGGTTNGDGCSSSCMIE